MVVVCVCELTRLSLLWPCADQPSGRGHEERSSRLAAHLQRHQRHAEQRHHPGHPQLILRGVRRAQCLLLPRAPPAAAAAAQTTTPSPTVCQWELHPPILEDSLLPSVLSALHLFSIMDVDSADCHEPEASLTQAVLAATTASVGAARPAFRGLLIVSLTEHYVGPF